MVKKKKAGRPRLEFTPVAIVDIGSNSIRLMVYDGLRRSPLPVFNEKLICGLGRGVALTGRLADESVGRALRELRRFRVMCHQIGAQKIYAVATAAVRSAENGPDFVEQAQAALGAKISVLSGKKEAHLTAMGLLAGIPDADGVVGDLGGGSLEVVHVKAGEIHGGATLPLGPLHLMDVSGQSIEKAQKLTDKLLAEVDLLDGLKNQTFYAVGGAWRNLARIHMGQNHYPLHVLHHYDMPRDAAQGISSLVSGLGPETLQEIQVIPKDRAATLPYGAMVLDRLIERAQPRNVVVSAYGVREGLLFSKLPKKSRSRDPLLSACRDFALLQARSPKHAFELCSWTDQLFVDGGLSETANELRLRHAACMLADISWRAHPDYRGDRSFSVISQGAFVGVDHAERIFLALVVFYRYEGIWSDLAPSEMCELLDEDWTYRARIISSAQRLAYLLSGAMPGLLPRVKLQFDGKKGLRLELPKSLRDLAGERVEKRFAELAMLVGKQTKIVIADN